MENKKGFIFDFDGVVIDTEKYHYIAWSHAFATVNATISQEEYEPLKSIGRDYIITYIEKRDSVSFSKLQKEQIVNAKDEKYKELKATLSVEDEISGVIEYIDFLKGEGYKTAVASSSIEAANTIKQFNLQDKFDTVIDGMFGIRRKPQPDMFIYACKKLNLQPKDCVVFEDSKAGVKASISAGIDCVYVGNNNHESAVLNIKDFKGFKRVSF